jgi:hypothetical protein
MFDQVGLFVGLPVSAALTHFKEQTKTVHAQTNDAVQKITPCHCISPGMLQMRQKCVLKTFYLQLLLQLIIVYV